MEEKESNKGERREKIDLNNQIKSYSDHVNIHGCCNNIVYVQYYR